MKEHLTTPSQTLGPYFAYGLTARQYGYDFSSLADHALINAQKQPRQAICITGRVTDGNGQAISDAMIELWQADEHGAYCTVPVTAPCDPGPFTGFGRAGTGATADHTFTFTTLKPGCTAPDAAPHIHVLVFMRGALRALYCRLYFADEQEANERDTILNTVAPDRRHTLLATPVHSGRYEFNIRVQGAGETVFFDL